MRDRPANSPQRKERTTASPPARSKHRRSHVELGEETMGSRQHRRRGSTPPPAIPQLRWFRRFAELHQEARDWIATARGQSDSDRERQWIAQVECG